MTGKKLVYAGLIALASIYSAGVAKKTNELHNALGPLEAKFEKIVDSKNERDFTFDYGGQLEKLAEAKNEFAKDNGAFARPWESYITPADNRNVASTPAPLALNPKYWFKDIDTSSLKPYLKQNK